MQSERQANILLVDDHPENLLALEVILEDLEQHLVKASSGPEALRRLLEEDFAVVLLDVQMPGMDGFETAQLIRQRGRSRETPIIFLTALHQGEGYVRRGYELGAVDYIFKPVVPEILKAKVAVFVELAKKTCSLQDEIARREQVEAEVRRLNADLERRVRERTAAIEQEVQDRREAEAHNAQLLQELEEADRRKDDFLAMLAHELRNPLGAATHALTLIQVSRPEYPVWHRAMEVLKRQLRHESRLVDQLLDVSRLVHGIIELRRETVDLAQLVREVGEDYRSILAGSGLRLVRKIPAEPIWVEGDAARLIQVFENLLTNAQRFTDAGGEVEVRVVPRPEDGTVIVSIRDTGIGIPSDVLPRIFEPFVQADRSLDRKRGGIGLGLPLVRGLVALHGGEVRAFSQGQGNGSEFTLTLPLTHAPPAAPASATSEAAAGRSLLVLVVEDIRDAAETLRDLLEFAGHQVEVAYTGPEGVEAALRFRPEVVLCDIGLPGMDGYEVARRLRKEAATREALLVAVTGYGKEEDRRLALEAGFDHHLVKPVDPEQLLHLLAVSTSRPA